MLRPAGAEVSAEESFANSMTSCGWMQGIRTMIFSRHHSAPSSNTLFGR